MIVFWSAALIALGDAATISPSTVDSAVSAPCRSVVTWAGVRVAGTEPDVHPARVVQAAIVTSVRCTAFIMLCPRNCVRSNQCPAGPPLLLCDQPGPSAAAHGAGNAQDATVAIAADWSAGDSGARVWGARVWGARVWGAWVWGVEGWRTAAWGNAHLGTGPWGTEDWAAGDWAAGDWAAGDWAAGDCTIKVWASAPCAAVSTAPTIMRATPSTVMFSAAAATGTALIAATASARTIG